LGGHGWSSIYFKYQSHAYSTTEVHNHFLQVWIETGIIGFLLFVGIWKWFVFMSYRMYKQQTAEQKILVVAVATAVLAVVTHSLYDFNLSLGAIGIFVFALMGINRTFIAESALPASGNRLYKPVLAVTVVLVMMVFVVRLLIGNAAFEQGQRQMQFGQSAQARTTFERAVRHDPFSPHMRLALAEAYEMHGAQTQNNNYLFRAKEQYRAAFRNNRNPFFANALGNFFVRAGLHDEGLDYLRQAVILHPGNINIYRHYVTGHLSAAFFSFRNNDPTAGQRYLEGVFATGKQVQELFDDRNSIALALGQAYFMLSDYEQSLMHLEKALNVEDDKAHALMMLALIYEKNGDSARHQELYARAIELNPASEGTYQAFKNF
jgi:Tfp pilus assembly protein PilF